jgi:YD repeat-containing protein
MRKLAFSILLAACSSSEPKLPSATFTPHLDSQETSVACGADIAYNGSPTWDLRYAYNYDSAGRLVAGTGTWANAQAVDTFAYSYSGNNFTGYVYTSGWDGSQEAVDAAYDADDNLVDYTWSYSDGTTSDAWNYTYSGFIGPNQPSREDINHAGDPSHFYTFVYDANNRLVQAIPDVGQNWTWTYDDTALTITADLGNGDIHGVQTYDADFRPLSETWGGTNPDVVDQSTTYAWDDDRLLDVSYVYGDQSQISTMRYDCSAARTNAGVMHRVLKPSRLH